jgi:hypothetical protein
MSYDTQAPATDVDIETLDLSIDDAIPQERTFLGIITMDQKEPGKFGPQWHIAVKPLSFTLNTESGSFHNWPAIKFSQKDGSLVTTGEYGRVVNAIRQVFGGKNEKGETRKIGVGDLVGLTGHFVLRKLEYGKDRVTGEVIAGKRDSLIAIRKATAEEIASAGVPAGTPANPTYSNEDVGTLLDLMAGKKVLEYTKGLGRNQTLSAELKNAVMNGSAANTLVEMGEATLVNGVLERATVTA